MKHVASYATDDSIQLTYHKKNIGADILNCGHITYSKLSLKTEYFDLALCTSRGA